MPTRAAARPFVLLLLAGLLAAAFGVSGTQASGGPMFLSPAYQASIAKQAKADKAAAAKRAKVKAAAALAATGDYGALVRAIDAHKVRSAVVDQNQHLVLVHLGDGSGPGVQISFPASDTTLPLRLARAGASVHIAPLVAPSMHTSGPPRILLIGGLFLAAFVLFYVVSSRRKNPDGARMKQKATALGGVDTTMRETQVTESAVRFSDVAGCDEAIEELGEMVDFLASPERFTKLGARIPSGCLLHGLPGTGKTLLARAIAGESGASFFSASGSDFVEKLVGVGAARVRALFAQARKNLPAIIFIDEIDALGRARGNGAGGTSEHDQTLNALLEEMDGFRASTAPVLVIGATNRKDILDPALLRPGRLARHVAVPLPAKDGRLAIMRIHAEGKPLAADVDLPAIAEYTHGFSGAQLAEIMNESAILAAREHADEIADAHVQEALRRVIAGPKRKSAAIGAGELKVIAYHEAGHVIAAELVGHDKARHVTIEPRDNAMGFALYGSEDKALHDERSLKAAMVAALGGRAAEQVVFGHVSSGAANDLEKTHEIARSAIETYGFSAKVGHTTGDARYSSDGRRALIESEIQRLIDEAYAEAITLLDDNRTLLNRMAETLLERKELDRPAIDALLADYPAAA